MKLTDFSKSAKFNRLVKIILPCLIGLFCIYYILTNFRWLEIGLILRRADFLTFFLSSLISTVAFWLLRAARWAFLLRGKRLDISFFKLYLYTAITIGFANFTPFQSGEALKVELLRKYGCERISGYTFFLSEKLLDFFCLSLLSLVGIFTLFGISENARFAIIGLTIFMAAMIIVFAFKGWRSKIRLFRRVPLPDLKTSVVAFLLTLASWATLILGWKFILQSVQINLSAIESASVISLTSVIGIISLVPGAIGVSEISVAVLLSRLGYENSTAQAGAVTMGIYSLVILILALVHLVILKSLNFIKNRDFSPPAKII